MDISNYRQYQAEQDLLKCGLSVDSINAIKSTSVVDRDGAQHVVRNSEVSSLAESPTQVSASSDDHSLQSIASQLAEQQRMFSRHKRFSDERLSTVERQLSSALSALKEVTAELQAVKSNARARATFNQRDPSSQPLQQQAPAQQSEQSQAQLGPNVHPAGAKEIPTQSRGKGTPIDRNGFSSESVQIENIFYCGNK
jgi:hypothetical protein